MNDKYIRVKANSLCSFQFSSKRISIRSEKPVCMYALYPFSQKCSLRCLWNSSHVRLIGHRYCDIHGFVYAGNEYIKLLNTSDLLRSNSLVRTALPTNLSARSFPFTPACPGQLVHDWSFPRRMSTTHTFQAGLPLQPFNLCSKLIESMTRMARVARLSSWGSPAVAANLD